MCKCRRKEIIPFGLGFQEYKDLPIEVIIENIDKYDFFVTSNLTKKMISEIEEKQKKIKELQAVETY